MVRLPGRVGFSSYLRGEVKQEKATPSLIRIWGPPGFLFQLSGKVSPEPVFGRVMVVGRGLEAKVSAHFFNEGALVSIRFMHSARVTRGRLVGVVLPVALEVAGIAKILHRWDGVTRDWCCVGGVSSSGVSLPPVPLFPLGEAGFQHHDLHGFD